MLAISTFDLEKKKNKFRDLLFHDKNPVNIIIKKKERYSHTYFDKAYYKQMYQDKFVSFPVGTMESSSNIFLHPKIYLDFKRFYEIDSPLANDLELIEEVTLMNEEAVPFMIEELIDERLHNLIFEFAQCLDKTKAEYYFAGISDIKLIIKKLLNHYVNILNDEKIQLSVIDGLVLTKELSDSLTEIYIEFLEDKLAMLDIDNVYIKKTIPVTIKEEYKFKWKGKQQDILELFVELQNKNWINNLDENSLFKTAELLCKTFDFSDSQKKEGKSPVSSIYQLLKGEFDNKKNRIYCFDKDGYKRKFDEIIESNND